MIFTVPYDSGHKGLRMGAGPLPLRDLFPDVAAEEINPRREFRAEIATAFELYGLLAQSMAQSEGFPVVLSGNCGACVGTAAGVGVDDLAVIWFDAYGDYMTPETTTSGSGWHGHGHSYGTLLQEARVVDSRLLTPAGVANSARRGSRLKCR